MPQADSANSTGASRRAKNTEVPHVGGSMVAVMAELLCEAWSDDSWLMDAEEHARRAGKPAPGIDRPEAGGVNAHVFFQRVALEASDRRDTYAESLLFFDALDLSDAYSLLKVAYWQLTSVLGIVDPDNGMTHRRVVRGLRSALQFLDRHPKNNSPLRGTQMLAHLDEKSWAEERDLAKAEWAKAQESKEALHVA